MNSPRSIAGQASRTGASRRIRRHGLRYPHSSDAPYCATNGCTSFLVATASGLQCPICGYRRRSD